MSLGLEHSTQNFRQPRVLWIQCVRSLGRAVQGCAGLCLLCSQMPATSAGVTLVAGGSGVWAVQAQPDR